MRYLPFENKAMTYAWARPACLEFALDDAGQGLVEYALIIALVSIVAIAALTVLGKKASNTLSNAASKLS